MENNLFGQRHPLIHLLLFALISLISVLSVLLISMVAGVLIFRVPVSEWMNMMDPGVPENIPILKFFQITQSFSLFVIPPIIFGWFIARNPWNYLQINLLPKLRPLMAVLGLALVILPVLNILAMLNQEMKLPSFLQGLEDWMQRTEEQAGVLTTAFLKVDHFSGFLVNLLMVVLIPAFGEEFFFRGVLQRIFQKWFRNPHVAIWLIAFIFAAFHLQFYGFLPRFALGILFGYLFLWSGNIWYPVFAHLVNNLLPVSLTYFFRNQFDPAELDSVGTGPGAWWWFLPSLIMTAVFLWGFYTHMKVSRPSDPSGSGSLPTISQ